MNDKSLAGTLGTLGLMPKEGEGYTRINKDKLDELKQIGVDHQPFLDALFGGDATKRTEETKIERHTILGELDNTTTPFEAAQYTFGIPLAGIGTYLNELTTDVDILSAMGKLAAWERHYNNMESMLPSILLAMLLAGKDGNGADGNSGIANETQPGISKEYTGKMKNYLAKNLGIEMTQHLFSFADYLNKAYKSGKTREDCLDEMGEFTKYMIDQKKGVQPDKDYAKYLKSISESQGAKNIPPERYGPKPIINKEDTELLKKYRLNGNGSPYSYGGFA